MYCPLLPWRNITVISHYRHIVSAVAIQQTALLLNSSCFVYVFAMAPTVLVAVP